ncbi:hypothetical protein [Nannocystis radixulma]|uniref:MYXO-CTERM domain-containing protein n=1 Tax=Nannocystis radixulma TaxID=2995305 RepID=A0ABT5B5C1_9BACT|nr:hypothetical protein [Nannocystis radixulma]MDC0668302.1 hypothetical protein [Nannocystis radixulma]
MRRHITVLAALAVLLAPSLARATCLLRCDVRLVFADCTTPEDGVWPADQSLGLIAVCGDEPQSSEGAPEPKNAGPDGCRSSAEATQIQLSRANDERTFAPQDGSFTEAGNCLGWPRFELDRPLFPGAYLITQPASREFRVSDAVSAETTKRVPVSPLSCFQCWGGGPPVDPRTLPLPPRAKDRAGCDVGGSGSAEALALCGLVLLLGQWRRRVR